MSRSNRQYYPKRDFTGYKQKKTLSTPQRKEVRNIIKNSDKDHRKYIKHELPVPSTGLIGSISDIAQGTELDERSGVVLTPTKLTVKGYCIGVDSSNIVRLIIFKWNSIGAPPVVADILEDVATGSGAVNGPHQFSNTKSYTIVSDKRYCMSVAGPIIKMFTWSTTRLSKITYTEGPAVTSGAGKYYYLAISDSDIASHPALDFITDLQFKP